MRINDTIKAIMKEQKISQTEMAEMLGKTRSQTIASLLARGHNMRLNNAKELLDILGYEIVIQPKSGGKRKEGAIVIDRGEE